MRYHNITKDDMLNGSGLRVVLWVSGCTHHCDGCHNPITWDINGGLIFDEAAKEEIFTELNKDYVSGLTLSGGDPLHPLNFKDVGKLVSEVKKLFPTKTIWLYTGFLFEDIENMPLLKHIDVLVDGPFVKELLDEKYPWAGSTNQRVIDVQKSLSTKEIVLYEGK